MDLKAQAEELLGSKLDQMRLVTDTTQFMELGRGDVLDLQSQRFLITGVAYEWCFGLDEEPKHWVQRELYFRDCTHEVHPAGLLRGVRPAHRPSQGALLPLAA